MFRKTALILLIVIILTLGVGSLVWAQYTCQGIDGTTYQSSDGNTYQGSDGNTYNCSDGNDNKDKGVGSEELDNPLGSQNMIISEVVGKVIKAFLGIIGTISLIMFIYGGFLMLTSAGKAEQIKKGQQTLVWASLGILVVFASYAILKFIFSAFGL